MKTPAPNGRTEWTRWLPVLACFALWLGVEVLRTRRNPAATEAPYRSQTRVRPALRQAR